MLIKKKKKTKHVSKKAFAIEIYKIAAKCSDVLDHGIYVSGKYLMKYWILERLNRHKDF